MKYKPVFFENGGINSYYAVFFWDGEEWRACTEGKNYKTLKEAEKAIQRKLQK